QRTFHIESIVETDLTSPRLTQIWIAFDDREEYCIATGTRKCRLTKDLTAYLNYNDEDAASIYVNFKGHFHHATLKTTHSDTKFFYDFFKYKGNFTIDLEHCSNLIRSIV
ncbi:hypothetical protein L0F63_006297, partial [Massospora cicadina]